MSRQVSRRELWHRAVFSVNDENLVVLADKFGKPTGAYRGMARVERRKLAKAYFAKAWKGRAAQ